VASGAGFASVSQSVLATIQMHLLAIHSLPRRWRRIDSADLPAAAGMWLADAQARGRGLKPGLGTSDAASALRIWRRTWWAMVRVTTRETCLTV